MEKHYAMNVTGMRQGDIFKKISIKEWASAHLERIPGHVMLIFIR